MKLRFWSVLVGVSVASVHVGASESLPDSFFDRQEWVLAGPMTRSSGLEVYGQILRAQQESGPRLADAPYLDLLLQLQLPKFYEPLYVSEKKKAYQEMVQQIRTTVLFDGFLESIVSNSVSDEMRDAANQMGSCLAKKALEIASECPLEEPLEEQVPEAPPLWQLAWARATCGGLQSACWIRKGLYAAAYPQLVEAKKDPKVREIVEKKFEELFPVRFLKEFQETLEGRRKDLSSWVAPKFGAASLSGLDQALVQSDGGSNWADRTLVQMDGFAFGLLADLESAKQGLHDSASLKAREMGATGLWAVVQRFLFLMGVQAASFSEGKYQWEDPAVPGLAPKLKSIALGGWSSYRVAKEGVNGKDRIRFERWDWEQYSKLPSKSGSVIRFFPHQFQMDRRGLSSWSGAWSAEQRLGDLSLLLEASVEFLLQTQKGKELSRYFAPQEELASKLLDPSSSVLFPQDFRLLGYGVLAAVFRNLIHPDFGLLEIQSKIEAGKGLGIRFFERRSLLDPSIGLSSGAETISVARLLIAASKLRALLLSDSDAPIADKKELLSKLDSMLQIGALTLGSEAQVPSGGFRSQLGADRNGPLDWQSSVQALRAIHEAYRWSQMPVLRLNLAAGVKWVKKELSEKVISSQKWSRPDRVALWHWLTLWDQLSPEWRDSNPHPADGLDWARLRQDLEILLVKEANHRADVKR